MIQKFSYDFRDRYIEFEGLEFAFRTATMENVYGPAPEAVTVIAGQDRLHMEATLLQYAGGQRRSPGRVSADLWRDGDELRFSAEACHSEPIKSITTLVRRLAAPTDDEQIATWPQRRPRDPSFPHFATVDGGTATILPLEVNSRHRRWSVYRQYSGNTVFNLSEDQTYTGRSPEISTANSQPESPKGFGSYTLTPES